MKKNIAIVAFLISLTASANARTNDLTVITTKLITATKVLDICSISETRTIGGYTITFTITATTCEEVKDRLNTAFVKATKALTMQ